MVAPLGLALESAGELASAALWRHQAGPFSFDVLAHAALAPGRGKADQLILVVEDLLDECHLAYRDLDVIAVNRGPGSFTGVRSAVALARGLALAAKCPVIGVTSHEVIALAAGPDVDGRRSLMVAENARRGEVYRQCFDAKLRPLDAIRAEKPDVAMTVLGEGRWRLVGTGAFMIDEASDEQADAEVIATGTSDARGVAAAAARRLAAGEAPIPGVQLQPLYIRPPDAAPPTPLVAPASPLTASIKADI
ncbi:MAG: tRNA (adenosine(37)-N6)-threonylcarbamoyltransferase complex dimerization subunit type 1 TsaB [Geminicoccaceae bacterium]